MEKCEEGIILIVDDNPTNLGVLFDFLTDSGFQVLVAQDGEDAIEQVEYACPDLILLDVLMPGIDGFETCRQLKAKESTKEIPVIFMTALSDTVDKLRGLSLGAVDYITKPLQHEEVLARVQIHLSLRNLTKKLTAQKVHLEEEIAERAKAQAALQEEIEEREKAQAALLELAAELETRVEERTAALSQANELLKEEISERLSAEAALQQSEAQLRTQAQWLEQTLRELQQAQSKLVQSEKMSSLGQLVAGVAHEINNPVSFISGNLVHVSAYTCDLLELTNLYQQHYPNPVTEIEDKIETIDLEFINDDLPKLLASMRLGSDRIRQIVLSLRNFSRVDESDKKEVDIHEGIDNTLLILQHRLQGNSGRRGIQIVKDYGELPLVECYAGQLNQVFMNLIVNAIDALEESAVHSPGSVLNRQTTDNGQLIGDNPTIRIRTEIINGLVSVRISDNGPGITDEVRRRLFDPFFTTKPIGKGTGIGLSISYQIVDKHGGQLKCVSPAGQGAEFVISIPIRLNALQTA